MANSMWRKAMVYLGLGPDAEYDDYDIDEVAPVRTAPGRVEPMHRPQSRVAARPSGPQMQPEHAPVSSGSVRPLPSQSRQEPMADPRPARPTAVRAVPTPATKPHVVSPTSFNDVQEVADKFKVPQPVIVNLQGADRDLSRRLIDFASGLCYGLGGHMERVADQVYLLTPDDVEVSAEDRRRLQERGLVDP